MCVYVCGKWRVSIESPKVHVFQFPNCCIFYCEMFVPGMFCFVLFFSYIFCQLAIVECMVLYIQHANFESITSIWSIKRSGNKQLFFNLWWFIYSVHVIHIFMKVVIYNLWLHFPKHNCMIKHNSLHHPSYLWRNFFVPFPIINSQSILPPSPQPVRSNLQSIMRLTILPKYLF